MKSSRDSKFDDSGTIVNPPLTLAIESVSRIILTHIKANNGERLTEFDIDRFLRKEYKVKVCPQVGSIATTLFTQQRKQPRSKVPSYEYMKRFLNLIFQKLKLNVECGIVALIYIERLMKLKDMPLTPRNWRLVLIASILTASKVWDDLASWNIEFAELFPIIGLKEVNELEKLFLTKLDYQLFVSPSVYAKYYFALRQVRQSNVPKLYLDLNIGASKKIIQGPQQSQPKSQTMRMPNISSSSLPSNMRTHWCDSNRAIFFGTNGVFTRERNIVWILILLPYWSAVLIIGNSFDTKNDIIKISGQVILNIHNRHFLLFQSLPSWKNLRQVDEHFTS